MGSIQKRLEGDGVPGAGRTSERQKWMREEGSYSGRDGKVHSSQQVEVKRLRLVGVVIPSVRLICLSFIGQSGPQGKVSWF